MHTVWKHSSRVLLTAAAIAAVVLLVRLFVRPGISDYSAAGELLLVAVLAVEGLVAVSELAHARDATRAAAISDLFTRFMEPEFRRKIQFVYSKSREELVLDKLSPTEQLDVTDVTARLEELALKIRYGVIPEKLSIELFWDWVIRVAQQLQPHVEDQRRRRGTAEPYREDFSALARKCKLYHLKKLGKPVPAKATLTRLLDEAPLSVFPPPEVKSVNR